MAAGLNIEGTVALVAGGTGGLGKVIAALLRDRGATVLTVSRDNTALESHVTADLRSADETQRVVDVVMSRTGRLDIVVNAVGVVGFGDLASTSIDTIEELFLTNTFAHMFLCKSALPHMGRGGVIVGISGIIAEHNLPGMAVYGASKAAMKSFNEGFGREARRVGVRVVDARPPHTETGLATRAIAGVAPRFPQGLDPHVVAVRIVDAIADGSDDLPASAFVS